MPNPGEIITAIAGIVTTIAGLLTTIKLLPQLLRGDFTLLPNKVENDIPPNEASDTLIQAINSHNQMAKATELAKRQVRSRLAPFIQSALAMLSLLFFSALLFIAAKYNSNPLLATCLMLLSIACALLSALTSILVIFDVRSLRDALWKARAFPARFRSWKEGYGISFPEFKNIVSTPDQQYIICDCRPKETRMKTPIPHTLPCEEISEGALTQLDASVIVFAFSDFGKESFDLVNRLREKDREKDRENTYDLGGIKGYSHLYDRTIRAQVYCDHAPLLTQN